MVQLYVEKLKNGLIRQFMCAGKLRILEKSILTSDTIQFIITLLRHPIVEKYPLRTSYLVVIIRMLSKQVEIEEHQVCDHDIAYMYCRYARFMLPQPAGPIFYKHYILDDDIDLKPGLTIDSVITIQETATFVSDGTTGLCTWEAGVALGVWALRNKEKLQGKFIVELGSGTGLSGISACVNCKPRKYWFTDCHAGVLDVIKNNIDINDMVHTFNCPYEVIKLPWENVQRSERFDEEKPDLILAADVIYDRTMFESLCTSLKYFAANNTTEIILFSTVRNPETHQKFLETLERFYLEFTEEILPDNYSMIIEQNSPIHITNIKKRNVNTYYTF
ncbi:Lysine methyltransferase,S-adenosyl-L-methionine-dependent methyltransferase [Cinara cedri]|uniref:Lysine methyltransferase,S-adenosyl-L-methionine-dependent methyltransferase n=1 Tax=Cinara cedri TaxID=506608 RepID=A0A5E4M5E2_9HEMI|nr:Lysine methyltransferase,S-adenosyl-L-methionine-dependent methyltransferase [Cinara cedri]